MILLSLHNPLTAAAATAAAVLVFGLQDGELNFELGNGSVKLQNPIEIQQQQQQTEVLGEGRRGGGNRGTIIRLYDPQFLGSGGGGAVFSYSRLVDNADNRENSATTSTTSERGVTQIRTKEKKENDVVVKISWLRSAESVKNECKILQELERKMVTGVESCLASTEYQDDPRRVMIVMEPVIEDSVGSISEIPLSLRPKVVDALVRTMVQMLAANVVTTDVQPLISTRTGQVVLIDMTEAKIMTPSPKLSFVDVALVSSFCTEIFNLIPENLLDVASKSLVSELQRQTIIMAEEGTGSADAGGGGGGSQHSYLPNEVYTILQGQTMLSQTALDYLDKMVLYTTDTTTANK